MPVTLNFPEQEESEKPVITTSKQLGDLVRRRRRESGLTQRELALSANVGERFIVDLENGKPTCQLGLALRVAQFAGVKLEDVSRPASEDEYDLPELA